MPARWLPLLYLGFAHACLAAALAVAALDPRGVSGFFYHPRMLAVAHLVTLGWISASILGSIYIVGPLAFRMPLPARSADFAAFGAFVVGPPWGRAARCVAPVRTLQALVFYLWTAGVPLIAGGLALDRADLVSAGAGGLFVAVLASLANIVTVLARLWRAAIRG
jgi:hypothetical protein